MAKQKKSSKSSGGRGSPEAILKRRVARHLNTLLTGAGHPEVKSDGRTEKRRQRLFKELLEGRGGEPLKPIDAVTHVNELLDLGETLASIKKQGVKPRKVDTGSSTVMQAITEAQTAYGFRPEAWRILGVKLPEGGGRAKAEPAEKPKTRGRKKARG